MTLARDQKDTVRIGGGVAVAMGRGKAGHRLTIELPVADQQMAQSISDALGDALEIVISHYQDRMHIKAEKFAEAILERADPPVSAIDEVLAVRQTIDAIFEAGAWLTTAEIHAAHPQYKNQSEPASEWKRRGRLFAVNYNGKDYFARYQFDSAIQPLPVIGAVLKALGPTADAWKIAAWFDSPNGWLGGRRPWAVLDDREAVIAAAVNRTGTYVA